MYRYIIYSAEGEPLKQCATVQLCADNVRPGNVSHDTAPDCAYPYVAWVHDPVGVLGVPFRTAAEAFARARREVQS